MPGHKTHAIVGFITAGILIGIAYKFGFTEDMTLLHWLFLIPLVWVYSLLPDIDSDVSKINKVWNTGAAAFGIYAIYTDQLKWLGIVAVLSILVLEWVKHRGVCHEEWFGALLAVPLYWVHPVYPFIALGSFISHVWIDGDRFK